MSTHPINTSFQYTLLTHTHPPTPEGCVRDQPRVGHPPVITSYHPSCQHILSPLLSTRPITPPSQHALSTDMTSPKLSTHPITHPVNTPPPSQHFLSPDMTSPTLPTTMRLIDCGLSENRQHILPLNTPFQHTLSTHPLNTPYQHTLSTHPLNTPSQHTTAVHHLNTPS